MKKIACLFACLVFLALTAFECGGNRLCCEMPPCSEIASLNGTWRLDYFQNIATGAADTDPEISGKSVVFTFSDDKNTGKISGHTFVNTVSGAYTLGPNCTFQINSFGGTKVGKPEWSSKAWLPSDSTVKGTYHVQPDKLILIFDQKPERMVFKRAK